MPKLYEKDSPKKLSESKEVSLWQDRISLAKKDQDSWAEDSGAKRFIKEYKGDYGIVFNTRNKKVPIPPINEVFTYVQSDIATTYNRDPYIAINAKAGTPLGAALWEATLNYWWRELKTKEEMEYEIIDKDLIGYSWHKVGYATQSEGSGETLKIADEKLYSAWLPWKDVIWNIGSKRPPYDCFWMAQRIVKPIEEIRKKYPKAKGMEGVPMPEVDPEDYKKSSYKDDIKMGVMWEIWDAQKKQILLLGEGVKDRYLEDPKPWPDYMDEFPFLMYWDFANPGSARPMSAISPWEPQVLSKMIIIGSAINHVKRWNRQAFVKNGTIDDNSLDKYERGDDGAIIVYNGDTADIKFADFGQLPTDFYMLMERLDAIIRNVNGQPEFVNGGVTKTATRTIGELQLMEQGAKGRQNRKIDRLETHCENIARHMMAHLKANFDFDQTLKITGDAPDKLIAALGDHYNPETQTVTFSPEEIEGDYDVDVKSGSTLPMDKGTRMQMYEKILTSVAPALANGAPPSNFLVTLINELLHDYDTKSLQEAYEKDLQAAEEAKQQAAGQQSVQDEKTQMEAAKREAQARQIVAETEIAIQQEKLRQMRGGDHKVGENISFKDLPPDGKVQMAQQAGINLHPADPGLALPPPPTKNGSGKP